MKLFFYLLVVLTGVLWLPHSSSAQTCNPSDTSGCPAHWPGRHGSTTPTVIPGTGYTINGVTTASVDVFWGIPYNPSVCPFVPPVDGNQSGCDISWVMPHEAPVNPNNYEIIYCMHQGGGSSGGVKLTAAGVTALPCRKASSKFNSTLGRPMRSVVEESCLRWSIID
jgi:hypothetical protein